MLRDLKANADVHFGNHGEGVVLEAAAVAGQSQKAGTDLRLSVDLSRTVNADGFRRISQSHLGQQVQRQPFPAHLGAGAKLAAEKVILHIEAVVRENGASRELR